MGRVVRYWEREVEWAGDERLGEGGNGQGMRDWEKEGVRGQNVQGDERLGERGKIGRGMRDWEREGRRCKMGRG